MKNDKSHSRFWTVLAALNVLALIYPTRLSLRAYSTDENLIAAFTFMGVIFLLVVVDAISIVVADALSPTSVRRTSIGSQLRPQRSSAGKINVIEIAQ